MNKIFFLILINILSVSIFWSCTEEKVKKPCDDINCSNHGKCIEKDNQVSCVCDNGYFNHNEVECLDKPVLICKTHTFSDILFKDVTDEYNLNEKNMIATNLVVTDFDQDHWPDIALNMGSQKRDDINDPKYLYRFFKNNKGVFEDYTKESKLYLTKDNEFGVSSFIIFGDVNNDDYPDALNIVYRDSKSEAYGDVSSIYLNNKDGSFSLTDKQELYSSRFSYPISSALFIDYNKDGQLDLFLAQHYGTYGYLNSTKQDMLFKGDGAGKFFDKTKEMGLETFPFDPTTGAEGTNHRASWGATACDLTGDGNEEIMVSAYGRGYNLLFQYEAGKYKNNSIASGFGSDDILNYKDNQFFLCFCKSHPNEPTCNGVSNPSIGCDGLENAWNVGSDDQPYRLGGNSSNSLCADFDNDGDFDLLSIELAHWHIGESSDKTQLLLNDNYPNNKLKRVPNEDSGLTRVHADGWNEGDLGGVAEDFNNDGKIDILISSSDYPDTYSLLYQQISDGKFKNLVEKGGIKLTRAHGVALIDFDRDGDYDIMMGQSLMRWSGDDKPKKSYIHLFENRTGQDSNRVMIDLKGAGWNHSNKDAIGAKIIVKADGKQFVRSIQGAYGLFGFQKDPFIIIGIGDSCVADEIIIKWPNKEKTETILKDIPANYVLIIREGKDLVYNTLEEYVK